MNRNTPRRAMCAQALWQVIPNTAKRVAMSTIWKPWTIALFWLVSCGTAHSQPIGASRPADTGESSSHRMIDAQFSPLDLLGLQGLLKDERLRKQFDELMKKLQSDDAESRRQFPYFPPRIPEPPNGKTAPKDQEPRFARPKSAASEKERPRFQSPLTEPPPPKENFSEAFRRLIDDARREVQPKPGEGPDSVDPPTVPESLGSSVSVPNEKAIEWADRLQQDQMTTWYSEWLRPVMERATEWSEPLRGRAMDLLRKLEETGGKLAINLPSIENFSNPVSNLTAAPPGEQLKTMGIVLVAVAAVVAVVVMLRARAQIALEEAEAEGQLSLELLTPAQVNSRADFVHAVDALALHRWGLRSKWWTHGRVADAFADLRLANAGGAFEMADVYEFARYAPEQRAFTRDQLDRARAALMQLSRT